MHIAIQELTKVYSGAHGLLPTNVTVGVGEFVAIVGHNGAGKSTLLKMLANWILPDGGNALIDGISIEDRLSLVRKIGFVPEVPNLFELFSVEYNLRLFADLFALPAARIETVLQEFDLLDFRRSRVQSLSKGLRQRVALARSLLADPPVLLLDEPSSGLDFGMTKGLYRRLKALNAGGKTILFTSHRPEELKTLATRMIVLHGGSLAFDGCPDVYFASKAHEDLFL